MYDFHEFQDFIMTGNSLNKDTKQENVLKKIVS